MTLPCCQVCEEQVESFKVALFTKARFGMILCRSHWRDVLPSQDHQYNDDEIEVSW